MAVAGLRGGDESECVKDIGETKEDDDRYHELGKEFCLCGYCSHGLFPVQTI